MSHFTVLVKLKKEELVGISVEDAVKAKLAPYQEIFGKITLMSNLLMLRKAF